MRSHRMAGGERVGFVYAAGAIDGIRELQRTYEIVTLAGNGSVVNKLVGSDNKPQREVESVDPRPQRRWLPGLVTCFHPDFLPHREAICLSPLATLIRCVIAIINCCVVRSNKLYYTSS